MADVFATVAPVVGLEMLHRFLAFGGLNRVPGVRDRKEVTIVTLRLDF